jgi:hypothetical protein
MVLQTALDKLGIENSIEIIDERTIEIMQDYQFYKNAPHIINNSVWKKAYIILNQLEPRLF